MAKSKLETMTVGLRPRGECQDCSWSSPHSSSTKELAKSHARTHPGHYVTIDVITRTCYYEEVT